MTQYAVARSLFDRRGMRKYLNAKERAAVVLASRDQPPEVHSFCVTLAITGARISEVLALTTESVDAADQVIIIETLKRRQRGVYRAIPVPRFLFELLPKREVNERLWSFGRTTAWKSVKRIMHQAGVRRELQMPKALRHGFAVNGVQNAVPLNVIQRWMGHARIETTTIYLNIIGDEEREFAKANWAGLDAKKLLQTSRNSM